MRQCRPTLSRWTVRGSYKSHGRSAAACPGLHDSQYPPSATSLLSFLSHSQGHCSRDRGLLPGKKAESVPRLRYFGQHSESKVSVVRVVGGALAAGGVPLPLPLSSEPSTLWCSPPSPAHFWLQLWCLEPSEVSPGTCVVGIPLGGERLVVARGATGGSPRPAGMGSGWARLVPQSLFPPPGLVLGPLNCLSCLRPLPLSSAETGVPRLSEPRGSRE